MSLDGVKRYIQKHQERLRQQTQARQRNALKSQTTLSGDHSPQAVGELQVQIRRVDEKTGEKGDWEDHHKGSNLVVTQAESLMAQMAIGAANSAFSYIELGNPTPATPPVLADTGLELTTGVNKALSSLTATANQVTAEVTFTTAEGNGFTFTEAGLFVGLLGLGTMFARKVFPGIAKTVAFELKLTWIVTFVVSDASGDCCSPVSLVGPQTVTNEDFYDQTSGPVVGGEASVGLTFDFAVGAGHLDVYLNGQRQVRGKHYNEVAAGGLIGPTVGPAGNKGINFIGITLLVTDTVYVVQRTLA